MAKNEQVVDSALEGNVLCLGGSAWKLGQLLLLMLVASQTKWSGYGLNICFLIPKLSHCRGEKLEEENYL